MGCRMMSSTGHRVSGDDVIDREPELASLERLVREGNHARLTGQRRIGKTSLLRELGHQPTDEGRAFSSVMSKVQWDVVADLMRAANPIRPVARRVADAMGHLFDDWIDEISALEFRVKIRAGRDAGSWMRHGKGPLRHCAAELRPPLPVPRP